MKDLEDNDKVSITDENGEEIYFIRDVTVGYSSKNCVLIILNNNIELNTNYVMTIPENTLESTDGIKYNKEIKVEFKTAKTVLKGRVITDYEINGSIIELIDSENRIIKSANLTDENFLFINMEAGQYTLKVKDLDGNEYSKLINIKEDSLNLENISAK